MRIVFLDFDGVLNADTTEAEAYVAKDPTEGPEELWTAAWLERTMVERLGRLVESTGASVVVISSWRQRRSLEELRAILREHGFLGQVLDVTPRLGRPDEGERPVRASEVIAWLANHPEVTSFVVLDDAEDFGPLAPRHVRTDASHGLTNADVERARSLLLQ